MRRKKEYGKRVNGVSTKLHPDFYDKIDKERIKFMEKHRLNRLSTVAFTGILYRLQKQNKINSRLKKNVKK